MYLLIVACIYLL